MHPSQEDTPVPGTYLVECYWPVHSTFVAGDEAVLTLFESVSAGAVREASEQAGPSVDRISLAEAVEANRS